MTQLICDSVGLDFFVNFVKTALVATQAVTALICDSVKLDYFCKLCLNCALVTSQAVTALICDSVVGLVEYSPLKTVC